MNVKSTSHTDQLDRDDAPRITADWASKAELRDGDVIIREASPPVRIGRPPKSEAERKRQVTLRIEPALLESMRRSGKGWQRRVEEVLRREYLGKPSKTVSMAALGKAVAAVAKGVASKSTHGKREGGVKRPTARRKSA